MSCTDNVAIPFLSSPFLSFVVHPYDHTQEFVLLVAAGLMFHRARLAGIEMQSVRALGVAIGWWVDASARVIIMAKHAIKCAVQQEEEARRTVVDMVDASLWKNTMQRALQCPCGVLSHLLTLRLMEQRGMRTE